MSVIIFNRLKTKVIYKFLNIWLKNSYARFELKLNSYLNNIELLIHKIKEKNLKKNFITKYFEQARGRVVAEMVAGMAEAACRRLQPGLGAAMEAGRGWDTGVT